MKQNKAILEELERIKNLEFEGKFDVDSGINPPTKELLPGTVDFLNKKLSSKIKTKLANFLGYRFFQKMLKTKQVIFKGAVGTENLKGIKGGVITCNHFSIFDSYAVYLTLKQMVKKPTIHKVVREGNYNMPGLIGFLLKNGNTLPLSKNRKTMMECFNAISTLLSRGEFVLIYPEQAMWLNYRKPRPFKNGAFKFAAKNNVPVIPFFITLEDSQIFDSNGFPAQEYTVHVGAPIYPDPKLNSKENEENMKNKNFEFCKATYERVYNTKLKYETKENKK